MHIVLTLCFILITTNDKTLSSDVSLLPHFCIFILSIHSLHSLFSFYLLAFEVNVDTTHLANDFNHCQALSVHIHNMISASADEQSKSQHIERKKAAPCEIMSRHLQQTKNRTVGTKHISYRACSCLWLVGWLTD